MHLPVWLFYLVRQIYVRGMVCVYVAELCMWDGVCLCVWLRGGEYLQKKIFMSFVILLKFKFKNIKYYMFSLWYLIICVIIPVFFIIRQVTALSLSFSVPCYVMAIGFWVVKGLTQVTLHVLALSGVAWRKLHGKMLMIMSGFISK